MAFLSFPESARRIAEKTGRDGSSTLIAAAASGRVQGEGERWAYKSGHSWRRVGKGFEAVSATWWAVVDDDTTLSLEYRMHFRAETSSLIHQEILGFHPGTQIPASEIRHVFHNIRFAEQAIDELITFLASDPPPPRAAAKALNIPGVDPSPPPETENSFRLTPSASKQRAATKEELLKHMRKALTPVPSWRNKDKDLVPLVKVQLHAAGLRGGRDAIRPYIDRVLAEKQENSQRDRER